MDTQHFVGQKTYRRCVIQPGQARMAECFGMTNLFCDGHDSMAFGDLPFQGGYRDFRAHPHHMMI